MIKNIKSPLRYPGGKSKAMKFLKDYIPPFKELREPFFGGGSFSFYCINKFKDKQYLASDLNYELFCFWNELKHNSKKVIKEVQDIFTNTKDGRILYKSIVERRESDLSDAQRAIDFFVLNRITFSGVVDAGGYSNQSYLKRFTQSSIERLKSAQEIAQEIEFLCEDYSYLLSLTGKDVFIFLDPPYYSVTKSKLYGKKGILHIDFDHKLFFKEMEKCKHNWLITYDNCDYIKDLYKNFYIVEWTLQYGMNNYKKSTAAKGKELLIANYDITNMGEKKAPTLFEQFPSAL